MIVLIKQKVTSANARVYLMFLFLVILLLVALLLPCQALATETNNVQRHNGLTFTIINTVEVKNPTKEAIKNVTVEFPLPSIKELGWQRFLGEEFYPKPKEIKTDGNGNRVGIYALGDLPAGGELKLVHRLGLINYTLGYTFDKEVVEASLTSQQLDSTNLEEYLQPEPKIQSNDQLIINYASGMVRGDTNKYIIAKRMFADINKFMTYDNSSNIQHSARNALLTGKGNCLDYSYLYVACLRAVGIPARMYNGYWYSGKVHNEPGYIDENGMIDAAMVKHAWVEFYIPELGWIVADPTFTYNGIVEDKPIKMVDWNRFAAITKNNRLISVGEGDGEESIVYRYQGPKPTVEYKGQISLESALYVFADLEGHWAKESVMNLYYWQRPIVIGLSEGFFGVNQGVTRAELVAMLNRVLDVTEPLDDNKLVDLEFVDVPSTHWAAKEINKGVARGIVAGFDDKTFKPNQVVTRGEMAAMLARVAKLDVDKQDMKNPFIDLQQPGYSWAEKYILSLYEVGLTTGVTENTFQPAQKLTRGEAAVFVDRWLKTY